MKLHKKSRLAEDGVFVVDGKDFVSSEHNQT